MSKRRVRKRILRNLKLEQRTLLQLFFTLLPAETEFQKSRYSKNVRLEKTRISSSEAKEWMMKSWKEEAETREGLCLKILATGGQKNLLAECPGCDVLETDSVALQTAVSLSEQTFNKEAIGVQRSLARECEMVKLKVNDDSHHRNEEEGIFRSGAHADKCSDDFVVERFLAAEYTMMNWKKCRESEESCYRYIKTSLGGSATSGSSAAAIRDETMSRPIDVNDNKVTGVASTLSALKLKNPLTVTSPTKDNLLVTPDNQAFLSNCLAEEANKLHGLLFFICPAESECEKTKAISKVNSVSTAVFQDPSKSLVPGATSLNEFSFVSMSKTSTDSSVLKETGASTLNKFSSESSPISLMTYTVKGLQADVESLKYFFFHVLLDEKKYEEARAQGGSKSDLLMRHFTFIDSSLAVCLEEDAKVTHCFFFDTLIKEKNYYEMASSKRENLNVCSASDKEEIVSERKYLELQPTCVLPVDFTEEGCERENELEMGRNLNERIPSIDLYLISCMKEDSLTLHQKFFKLQPAETRFQEDRVASQEMPESATERSLVEDYILLRWKERLGESEGVCQEFVAKNIRGDLCSVENGSCLDKANTGKIAEEANLDGIGILERDKGTFEEVNDRVTVENDWKACKDSWSSLKTNLQLNVNDGLDNINVTSSDVDTKLKGERTFPVVIDEQELTFDAYSKDCQSSSSQKPTSVMDMKNISALKMSTFCEVSQTMESSFDFKKNQFSQTHESLQECCNCGSLCLSANDQKSQEMARGSLVKLSDKETAEICQQLMEERQMNICLNREIAVLKDEIKEERLAAAEYKLRCEELRLPLRASREMILTPENIQQETDSLQSSLDQILPARSNEKGAATEEQSKLEAVQSELIQAKKEIYQLRQQLDEANKNKRECLTSSVGDELLQIVDDSVKDKDLQSLQIQNEYLQNLLDTDVQHDRFVTSESSSCTAVASNHSSAALDSSSNAALPFYSGASSNIFPSTIWSSFSGSSLGSLYVSHCPSTFLSTSAGDVTLAAGQDRVSPYKEDTFTTHLVLETLASEEENADSTPGQVVSSSLDDERDGADVKSMLPVGTPANPLEEHTSAVISETDFLQDQLFVVEQPTPQTLGSVTQYMAFVDDVELVESISKCESGFDHEIILVEGCESFGDGSDDEEKNEE